MSDPRAEKVAPREGSIQWILECGCDPDSEHCNQCDERRIASRLLHLDALVERACQRIYREHDGYWPSIFERHCIALALLEVSGRG